MAYTITVAGPGGCIDLEMAMIEKLFKDAGYTVEVENDHPSGDSADVIVERTRFKRPLGPVRLVADHCPWGG